MLYSIDTSALIFASRVPYRRGNFPGFWSKMDELMRTGVIGALEDVKKEILRKDDEISDWVKNRAELFIQAEEDVQIAMAEILERFPDLSKSDAMYGETDAAVIALAKTNGCSVISQENKRGSEMNPKIPYVCNHYQIRCIDIFELVTDQGWVFN